MSSRDEVLSIIVYLYGSSLFAIKPFKLTNAFRVCKSVFLVEFMVLRYPTVT